jgi:hypothetical protein
MLKNSTTTAAGAHTKVNTLHKNLELLKVKVAADTTTLEEIKTSYTSLETEIKKLQPEANAELLAKQLDKELKALDKSYKSVQHLEDAQNKHAEHSNDYAASSAKLELQQVDVKALNVQIATINTMVADNQKQIGVLKTKAITAKDDLLKMREHVAALTFDTSATKALKDCHKLAEEIAALKQILAAHPELSAKDSYVKLTKEFQSLTLTAPVTKSDVSSSNGNTQEKANGGSMLHGFNTFKQHTSGELGSEQLVANTINMEAEVAPKVDGGEAIKLKM